MIELNALAGHRGIVSCWVTISDTRQHRAGEYDIDSHGYPSRRRSGYRGRGRDRTVEIFDGADGFVYCGATGVRSIAAHLSDQTTAARLATDGPD
jgi:hypothetical protein